jgi:Flp pilus assembly protein TadG
LRRQSKRSIRRGASLVESVITTTVFMTLALGTVDLGIAVFQYQLVCEASRQGARIASVHGSLAPADGSGTAWGPTAYSGAGNSTGPSNVEATTFSSGGLFTGLNAANVTVAVAWPTGGNSVQNGDTVEVTVSTTWTPVLGNIFGSSARTISATSIMPIAH